MPGYRRNYSRGRYNPRYGIYRSTTKMMPRMYKRPASSYVIPRTYRGYSRGQLKRAIAGMAEHKYVDYNSTEPVIVHYTPQFFCLTEVDQGSSTTTRVGDKTTGVSIQLRMKAWYDSATATLAPNTVVRVIVFIWKDDTEPEPSDLFQSTLTINDCCLQQLDHDRRIKRKVLLDTTFTLRNDVIYNSSANAALLCTGAGSSTYIKKYLPLSKLPTRLKTVNYQGGTTDAVNHIYLCVIADANPNTSLIGPKFDFISRYNYVDV